jgi:hypothetical protein
MQEPQQTKFDILNQNSKRLYRKRNDSNRNGLSNDLSRVSYTTCRVHVQNHCFDV